ncbi:unnamed protein product [Lasius platythorax]|uniref:Uncharacterized protein n=1 Tax=Lasius platythorax TaxID=488582 RepID=A0AAV2NSD9_9HYME
MRSATDSRAWIRIKGFRVAFPILKTHRRRRIDELGPLVNVGEPFATKVPLFLFEPVGQSSTGQERLSTQ